MKQNTKQSRRRFLKESTLVAGGILSSPILSKVTQLFPTVIKENPPLLKAVVVGDSAMWGQGLLEKQKFAYLSVQEIGELLGRKSNIEINLSHSGAPIRLGGVRDCDPKCKRSKFVDTYPTLFNADLSTSGRNEFETDFIENENEERAVLFGEIPSPFPTIRYQIKQIDKEIGQNIDLVLMNGGANDLDFEKFLNPEKMRNDFIEHYDPLIEEYTYKRVKALIKQARDKFPNAVLIYTGYFSPFAPGHSNAQVRNLIEYLSGTERWKVLLNKKIIEIENVDQLVLEIQHRSQFGLTRSLYWLRKVIAEANADDYLRGPGVLFVHPQFTEKNTVFEENSFFHSNYKIAQIKDPAKQLRYDNIERKQYGEETAHLLLYVRLHLSSQNPVQYISKIRNDSLILRNKLNGPKQLIDALDRIIKGSTDWQDFEDLQDALLDEIGRIEHAKIASFVHPNERGARRYANIIVKRYKERIHEVNLNNDLVKFNNLTGLNESEKIDKILKRYYNLKTHNLNAASISQLMIVDSIALEIVTSPDSEKRMFDNIFLNLGSNRWQLNFPYRHAYPSSLPLKILGKQFAPGTTDLFTFDGRGMHLSSITQFTIDRKIADPNLLAGKDPWVPTNIRLSINGLEVFDVPFFGNLSRNPNDKLTFPYPYK